MKVVYVYDALCGWCYGFSPVMEQFYETYSEDLDVEVVSGGMITGQRIGPIGDVAPYIKKAYMDVENATGVKFGDGFLKNILDKGETVFTSIPPAIALSVYKNIAPEHSVKFAAALQKGIYFDGIEPMDFGAYGTIASHFGLEADSFVAKLRDPFYLRKAEEDFRRSNHLGVTGFPTVFIENNAEFHRIATGYTPFDALKSNYLKIKEKVL